MTKQTREKAISSEHHGPTLYYAGALAVRLCGARDLVHVSERDLRLVPVLFGCASVVLVWALLDGLGLGAVLGACAFAVLSPAMVYYNRFFIQESLLVFFTAGAIVCGWRYSRRPGWGWALGAGVCLGLMHATKETCVLAYAAMAVGVAAVALVRGSGQSEGRSWRQWLRPEHAVVAVAAAAAVSVLFFSSFFTNLRGPLDSLLSYVTYVRRAGGDTRHIHPPWFYLHMLVWFKHGAGPVWSEGVIVALAVAGGLSGWRCAGSDCRGAHRGLVRFLTVYTGVLLMLYSLIPYKTPWCMLSFLYGMILLAGIGAQWLLCRQRHVAVRAVSGCVIVAGGLYLARVCVWTNGRYCADPRNPYVYAQTTMDFLRLPARIQDLSHLHPDGTGMRINVIAAPADTWPLPWYLRGFSRVGYWTAAEGDALASLPDVLVSSSEFADVLDQSLGDDYITEYYGLRPGTLLALHIRRGLWDRFIRERTTSTVSSCGYEAQLGFLYYYWAKTCFSRTFPLITCQQIPSNK
jgi:uncharacterized protein (TIGR03663 family)